MAKSLRYAKAVPVTDGYDVVVRGSGPAGCAAALAARREGLTVLLVEAQAIFGGMSTNNKRGLQAVPAKVVIDATGDTTNEMK